MPQAERSYIDFRRERRVGDVINVTFAFLRDEFPGLLRATIFIVGPVVLVGAVLTAGQMTTIDGMFDPAWLEEGGEAVVPGVLDLVGVAFYLIAYALLYLVFYAYAMLYAEQGPGPFSPGEVWERVKAYAGRFVTTSLGIIVVMIPLAALNLILCLGTIAFIGLLVWLLPIFSLLYPARFDRRESFWNSLKRCNRLVKGEWGAAFGLFFVMQVLVLVVSTAISVAVLGGYGLISTLVGSGVVAQLFSVVLGVVSGLTYVGNVLPAVAFVIHYYNLVEQKEGIGLEERIEAMAADTPSPGDERLAL